MANLPHRAAYILWALSLGAFERPSRAVRYIAASAKPMNSNPPHLAEKPYCSNRITAVAARCGKLVRPAAPLQRIWILLAAVFVPAALAQTSPWAVVGVQQTSIPSGSGTAVMSASGDLFSIGSMSSCTPPTLKVGDTSSASICVAKTASSGQQVFSVQIGGLYAQYVTALAIDQAGNVDIAGTSVGTTGFLTTPGAYESTPSSTQGSPWYCELSGADGHPLFCTYIDVLPYGAQPFATDPAGSAYFAGECLADPNQGCVEKLNPKGDSIGYLTQPESWIGAYLAVDSNGNVGIAGSTGTIVKLDAHGAVSAAAGQPYIGQSAALAFDAVGDLEIVFQRAASRQFSVTGSDLYVVRRYKGDLSAALFEGNLTIPGLAGMSIDSAGVTYLWGTAGPDLAAVHPTQPCDRSSNPFLARVGNDGTLLQVTYLNTPLSAVPAPIPFISPGGSMFFNTTGAMLPARGVNWEILNLGPATAEISLSCMGSAASLTTAPLAPNEIVSLFWTGVGPSQALTAAPGASGGFPLQLGGVQVTFDGVPAPMLYADSARINLVTPRVLQGRSTTHICAMASNTATNCIDVPVLPAAPDIFAPVSGYSLGAIPNGIITLFLTGLGTVTPAPADGSVAIYPLASQDLKPQVVFSFGGITPGYHSCSVTASGDIIYAGPAPMEIEGLAQINVSLPGFDGCLVVLPGYVSVEVLLPDGKTWASSRGVQIGY